MKTRYLFLLVFLLTCISAPAFSADLSADFNRAGDLYKTGKYDEAAQIYSRMLDTAGTNQKAVLFYNFANSQYRMGRLNESILAYERALALNPWFKDARHNLAAVRSKIEYKIEDRRNLFIRLNDLTLKWIKTEYFLAAVLFFLFIFLVSSALWLRRQDGRIFWAFPRLECFVLLLAFGMLAGLKIFYAGHYAEAIVMAKETEVRYGPSSDNQSLMKLGGGLKVFVVDAREDWSRVVTWNGETGWIKNEDLGRVNL